MFCRKVIRRSVLNQLRGYVRYCKNYGTVPLEETEESVMAVYDDVLEGKVKIPVIAGQLELEYDTVRHYNSRLTW